MSKYKKNDSNDSSVDTSQFESGLSDEEPEEKNSYKQSTTDKSYDIVFEQHFGEVIEQAEAKTQGYNRTDRIEQLETEAENEDGWKKYFFKAKSSYHQAVYSFAKNDGYVTIGNFNIGWMLPQFLTVVWILSLILSGAVSPIFEIVTLLSWIAIPVSIYFIFDVFDYLANEQITQKPTKILYALFGVIPVLGVLPFHLRSEKHQNKSIELFVDNNQKVIDYLAQKYQ